MNLTHVKVGDFGISGSLTGDQSIKTNFGTMEYVAPEIWKDEEFKYEPDIFALGVIFHELLIKEKPFPAGSNHYASVEEQILKRDMVEGEIMNQIHYTDEGENEEEDRRMNQIKINLTELIIQMLEKDKDKRINIDLVLSIYIYIYIYRENEYFIKRKYISTKDERN